MIAVTKGRSVEEIEPLIAAGHRDFGENRVQDAAAKWPALRSRHSSLRLHMIGRLQSNKADEAITLFDCIHSLDRPSLLAALVKAGEKADRLLPVHVQVNIGAEEQKGGVPIAEPAEARSDAPRAVSAPRARMATRICDGRPLGAAGVNLKSAADALLAKAAASRGSAAAGVKLVTRSNETETAGGRFLASGLAEAMAGTSNSAPAASAPAIFPLFLPHFNTDSDSL